MHKNDNETKLCKNVICPFYPPMTKNVFDKYYSNIKIKPKCLNIDCPFYKEPNMKFEIYDNKEPGCPLTFSLFKNARGEIELNIVDMDGNFVFNILKLKTNGTLNINRNRHQNLECYGFLIDARGGIKINE